MKLYNTLTRKSEEFVPLEPGRVKMYVCGPTVYDYFHIGNARPFIVFDVFRRYLEYRGYRVTLAQNITDVDDKIINKATSEGIAAQEVARRYTEAYFEDLERLDIHRADVQPRATETIPQMIEFIQRLIDKGYAYDHDGNVYFRVRKFKNYGQLSGKSVDQLKSGARVAVDERKEDPLDFALWKAAKPGEPSWPSPWGEGRPGWHLECSVMATSILGDTLDIHAGGTDLIFPHHENEIAQSEAATGQRFVRYWMHNELLHFEGEKMSKSLGNFEYAREITERYGPEAVRYFYLAKHYRTPISFSHRAMAEARRAVERVYRLLEEIESQAQSAAEPELNEAQLSERGRALLGKLSQTREAFISHMDDDFNTAGALGQLFELVRELNLCISEDLQPAELPLLRAGEQLIRELGRPLGLFQGAPWQEVQEGLQGELIELLIEVRSQLRIKREYQLADEIRQRLSRLGVELKDQDRRTLWSYGTASQGSDERARA